MPIPDAVRSVIHDPAFWSDYFREGIYYNSHLSLDDPSIDPSLSGLTNSIVLSITPRHRLCLLLGEHLDGLRLELLDTQENSRTTIAHERDDDPLWVLRWEEVDLFGRCLALQDPEWSHPGLLVLLLSRAAPATTDKEAALAFPLLESAWKSLGLFSPARINSLIDNCDSRVSNLMWRFEKPHGWMLGSRSINSWGKFDFSSWNQFVNYAEAFSRASVSPDRFLRGRTDVERLALAIAETADWQKALALADTLEGADCRQVAVLAALRSGVPAQILWVLELLLGEPQGRLIRRHLGSPPRPLRPAATHRLEVQFPRKVDPQLLREFKQTLFDQNFGSTYYVGGISWPLPGTTASEAYATTLVGDASQGLEAIRRVLARYGPPPDAAIFSWQEKRHLSLTPGAGLAPDPRGFGHEPESFRASTEPAPAALDLEVQSVLARLATRPVWLRNDKGSFLTWIEYRAKDHQGLGTQVMRWQPQTEQELDNARRFYAAGNWRSYKDIGELLKQPRQPGDYVVRSGLGGYYAYLAARDDSFTNDVREALVMTHEEAVVAVIRLTKEQQLELRHNPILCWEPIRLDDAIVCHDKFARAGSPHNSPSGLKDNAEAGLGFGCVADPGDAREWTYIAWQHYAGLGWHSVGPDPVAALHWYRQAAEKGDALAQASLGFCDASGDLAGALRWYSRAADEGKADAQCLLGQMYRSARGVEQDYAKALQLFRLSADAGRAEAQYELGLMYEFAYGVPEDTGEALRMYRLALDQGFLHASEGVRRLSPAESERNRGSDAGGPKLAPALEAALQLAAPTELQLDNNSIGAKGARALAAAPNLAGLRVLNLAGNDFRTEGARALAAAPHLAALTELDLSGNFIEDEGARALAAAPLLASLKVLDLAANSLGAEGIRALAAAPHLGNLEVLDLTANDMGAAGAQALAAAPHLARLRVLNLKDNDIGAAGAQALAAAPHLAQLRVLNLESNYIGAAGAEALAAAPHLGTLTELDLEDNNLRPEGARALAASPHLTGLRVLNLSRNRIRDGGARALAAASLLASLRELDLRANSIGPAGARALAAAPHLAGLNVLKLGSNDIGAAVASALAAAPHLASLTGLYLACNDIGDVGTRALAEAPHLATLTDLDLSFNGIGAEGARALASAPHLARLKVLNLECNDMGTGGAQALASSPHLTTLTKLKLGSNAVGPEGARALAASPNLATLTELDLYSNEIGAEGARALAASPHVASLTALHLGQNDIKDEGGLALASSPYLSGLQSLVLWGHFGAEATEALRARFGDRVCL